MIVIFITNNFLVVGHKITQAQSAEADTELHLHITISLQLFVLNSSGESTEMHWWLWLIITLLRVTRWSKITIFPLNQYGAFTSMCKLLCETLLHIDYYW